jgi:hypothetical protein
VFLASTTTDWLTAGAALVAAIAAAGAFFVALAALRPQMSDFRMRRVEAERLRAEAERLQASRVTAWAERRTDEGRWLVVRNANDEPIFDCYVWLIVDPQRQPVNKDGPTLTLHPNAWRTVVTPNDEFRYLVPAAAMRGRAPKQRPPVEVVFRDSRGRWWWRDRHGALLDIPRGKLEDDWLFDWGHDSDAR